MARAAPAADRAANIISFLSANRTRAFTLSELVRHLGMNIASAHATLAVLCDCGFLLRDPVHRTYVLGPALAATGFAALDQHPAIEAAIEQAEALSEELDAEVSVSAIAGRDVIMLARRGPAGPTPGIGYPGDRAPLLAPFGAVFIAWAGQDSIDSWLERAAISGPRGAHYRALLADIRHRGFSIPLTPIGGPAVSQAIEHLRDEPSDEEAEQDVVMALHVSGETLLSVEGLAATDVVSYRTIVAPIFDPIGRVLLSLSLTGSDEPAEVGRVLELGRRVAQAASVATLRAHGRMPTDKGAPEAASR